MRRPFGFVFLRSLFWTVVVGGLTGFIVSSVSPTKRGKSTDIILGVVGAFLGGTLLIFLRGSAARPIGALLFEIIGALVLIFVGRSLRKE